MSDHPYIIATGRDGRLLRSADIGGIVRTARAGRKLVVHLHGGLVDEASGVRTARRLAETYVDAGAVPVFMVWQSGLLEVIRNNLDEIVREELFRRMLTRVLQFTVGKLWQEPGQRAAGMLAVPDEPRVRSEIGLRERGIEPFVRVGRPSGLTGVNEGERLQLEEALESDPDLLTELERVLDARHPESTREGSRGVTVRREASSASLIDPEVLDQLDRGEGGERGILSLAVVAGKCGRALVRVIERFRAGTDHRAYPTVVEELLREFYLANAGGAVWSAMKQETAQTFEDSRDRGGRLLLDGMGQALADGARPPLTIVAHSAGAVYLDNLLTEVARGRDERYRQWPDDARFQVVLLAPASTYQHFTAALDLGERLISELRMFTMDDASECADQLVGPLYPRSLLYFVSGVLERDTGGASAWAPVLGLARYREDAYRNMAMLERARTYLTEPRVVLSPSAADAPPGSRAAATSHGGFDDDPLVLESIAELIRSS